MTPRKALRTGAVAALLVPVALAGCGGSSTKPAYCQDKANLEKSVSQLKDVNVTKTGLNGLQSQLQVVQSNAQALARSAQSEFGPQAQALKSAVSSLTTSVKNTASSPSAADIGTLSVGVQQVSSAFKDLSNAISTKCK